MKDRNEVKFIRRHRRLQDALQFFDMTMRDCVEETKLRKRYKNLSLLHHPDRNNNSQESVERMQVINGHYNLLLMELRRRSSKEQQEWSSALQVQAGHLRSDGRVHEHRTLL